MESGATFGQHEKRSDMRCGQRCSSRKSIKIGSRYTYSNFNEVAIISTGMVKESTLDTGNYWDTSCQMRQTVLYSHFPPIFLSHSPSIIGGLLQSWSVMHRNSWSNVLWFSDAQAAEPIWRPFWCSKSCGGSAEPVKWWISFDFALVNPTEWCLCSQCPG